MDIRRVRTTGARGGRARHRVRQLLVNAAAGHIVPDHTEALAGPIDDHEAQPAADERQPAG